MLDTLVEDHLNLQVRISYPDHHDFLLRHGLKDCDRVLDVGTGNGTFVSKLAADHPGIQFVGIDKRKPIIDGCTKLVTSHLSFSHVDMFSQKSTFDFSEYDGFLMRYFLLHVDNAQKILDLFKAKAKRPSKFWVIDLDWSEFKCEPHHPTFDKMTNLIKDFCTKISIESLGGQNVVPLFQKHGFQKIVAEHVPFSKKTIPLEDLALYLKQEVMLYSRMKGSASNDPETMEIVRFIDEEVRSDRYQISYGMILVSAEL